MSLIEPQTRRFSREEYYAMADLGMFEGQHVELIEGEIIEMAPQKNPHMVTIGLVQRALGRAFPEREYWIRTQGPITFSDGTEPEPDIAVVAGSPRDYKEHPDSAKLIVEISETTLRFDRGRKARLYARYGIGDYWIVNLVDRQVEVCRGPVERAGGEWVYGEIRTFGVGEVIFPLAAVGVGIAVGDLLP